MARFFQIPNFKKDDYVRPNQRWVCGRACDGKGCIFGPDAAGHCHTTGECRPARTGDRWTCTRPESHGGSCPEGPDPNGECCHQIGPCQPVLGLRALRGRYAWGASVFTVGLLLALFAGPGRGRWIDPGPLTSAHALSNTRCSDCHAGVKPGHGAALGSFLVGVHGPVSSNCLQCHSLGGQPLSPHGYAPAELERIRAASPTGAGGSPPAILALARMTEHSADASLECASCHKEHHGSDSSLTGFSNQQCQVCHVATFGSFSKGHPEFASYPFKRRTRIIFDHAKHLQVHFADKEFAANAPAACSACHVPSPTGTLMLVRGFEQTCAACHGAEIEGEGRAGDKGIAFFRVPGLDAATLAEKGHPVGEWPAEADGKITPFTRLLLARDPAASSALGALEGVDLTDLRSASPDKLAAAETLAWSLKSLFADLVTDGQGAMVSRLGRIVPDADRGDLRAMTAELPRDGLIAAQEAWFPGLFTEVANYRAGIRPLAAPPAAPKAAAPAPAAKAPAGAGGDDLLDTPAPASPAPPAKPAAAGGDDLLADSPAPAAKPAPVPAPAAKAASDDLGGDDLSAAPTAPAAAAAKPAAPAVAPLKVKEAEDWAVAGGWYRPADSFTLYYRPGGHADAFLTIWLTVAGRLAGDARDPVAQSLFTDLGDSKAPGLCIKCHSVDAAGGTGARIVNWHAGRADAESHPATKFSHATHFSLLTNEGCQTCHQLKPEGDYLASFGGKLDPSGFVSNFGSVTKATCASCHNDKVAREDCLLCHNYHTGEFETKIAAAGPMKPLEKKAATPAPPGT